MLYNLEVFIIFDDDNGDDWDIADQLLLSKTLKELSWCCIKFPQYLPFFYFDKY